VAYNATLSALLWDATAHQERQNFSARPSRACRGKLDRATC